VSLKITPNIDFIGSNIGNIKIEAGDGGSKCKTNGGYQSIHFTQLSQLLSFVSFLLENQTSI
jgi:hypothetical protein